MSWRLDEIRGQLERRFPAWRIWYVREIGGGAKWFAQQGQLVVDEWNPDAFARLLEGLEENRRPGPPGPA